MIVDSSPSVLENSITLSFRLSTAAITTFSISPKVCIRCFLTGGVSAGFSIGTVVAAITAGLSGCG